MDSIEWTLSNKFLHPTNAGKITVNIATYKQFCLISYIVFNQYPVFFSARGILSLLSSRSASSIMDLVEAHPHVVESAIIVGLLLDSKFMRFTSSMNMRAALTHILPFQAICSSLGKLPPIMLLASELPPWLLTWAWKSPPWVERWGIQTVHLRPGGSNGIYWSGQVNLREACSLHVPAHLGRIKTLTTM